MEEQKEKSIDKVVNHEGRIEIIPEKSVTSKKKEIIVLSIVACVLITLIITLMITLK